MTSSSSKRTSNRTVAVVSVTALAAGFTAAAAPQVDAAPRLRTCTVRDLRLSMGRREVGAGRLFWPIRFTNRSQHTCALRGYPGVRVLDRAHRQIGSPALWSPQHVRLVTLRPGQTATSIIHTTNGPVAGSCLPRSVFLQVYPPASASAVPVRASLRVCSHVFEVGPVTKAPGTWPT